MNLQYEFAKRICKNDFKIKIKADIRLTGGINFYFAEFFRVSLLS